MKLPAEIVDQMREAIEPLDTPMIREQYRRGDFPRSESVKDLDKRYRWDLFWAIPFKVREAVFGSDDGVKDSHVDTALRQIVRPL